MTGKDCWNILVVDDERDIHEVTKLALKRKKWRDKEISLVSTYSADEARIALESRDASYFDVALIDVVMETDHAGLELCRHIRLKLPSTLRMILRTGQPGVAPEESVMTEYDIDHYLPKTEAAPERVYGLIRSCLRVSQEIRYNFEITKQLGKFSARLLSEAGTFADFIAPIDSSLSFVEYKYSLDDIGILIESRNRHDATLSLDATNARERVDYGELHNKAQNAIKEELEFERLYTSEEVPGLADNEYLCLIPLLEKKYRDEDIDVSEGQEEYSRQRSRLTTIGKVFFVRENWRDKYLCLFVRANGSMKKYLREQLLADIVSFSENWKLAYSAFCMQKQTRQNALMEGLKQGFR